MITLQFVPYAEIEGLSQAKKIRKLLSIVRQENIVVLEGKLKVPDETELIKETMEEIDDRFKGIEIAVLDPQKRSDLPFLSRIRSSLADVLVGNRVGMTIIGPATVVKEIKKDPNKIQLFAVDSKKRRKR